jgi:hypothetical protein
MNLRKLLTVMAATCSFGAVGLVGSATPAFAAECGHEYNVNIDGGRSNYSVTCQNGRVYVNGRVTDTSADGWCIRVKALMNGVWHYSDRACPKNTTKSFSWSEPGSAASVYTYAEK